MTGISKGACGFQFLATRWRCFSSMTTISITRKQSVSVHWHRASNMAVNLTDLSLPQLEGLKTQLDQVVEDILIYMSCGCFIWCVLHVRDDLNEKIVGRWLAPQMLTI